MYCVYAEPVDLEEVCGFFYHSFTSCLNKKMGKSATGLPIVKIFRGNVLCLLNLYFLFFNYLADMVVFLADKTSIQNVINTTRILINPDIPEVETLKNRFV
jgi:hypothetical protein